jgi:MFS family permease
MVRPSRVRGRVLTFAFLLTVITYLDRVCISVAAPAMMAELHLTVLQMSAVFSAFILAYSLFEIPSGWLGDVRGPRRVLTRIVLWWSAFTMLTGSVAFSSAPAKPGRSPTSSAASPAGFPSASAAAPAA